MQINQKHVERQKHLNARIVSRQKQTYTFEPETNNKIHLGRRIGITGNAHSGKTSCLAAVASQLIRQTRPGLPGMKSVVVVDIDIGPEWFFITSLQSH